MNKPAKTVPKGWETTKQSNHPRRELSDNYELDAAALDLLPLLDGLSSGQAIAVLKHAEQLIKSFTTFSINSPVFREYQQELQAHLDGDRESL